jgi:transposase
MEFASPDQWISEDSYVRFIDTWTDQVATEIIADHRKAISETAKASGLKTASTDYGRKPYNPASLMKLYIYGNINKIRSSRKLARECRINLEVRWLLSGVEPDFRTISDFRKDYKNELPKLFLLFNDFLRNELSQETGKQIIGGGFYSIDGTKIRANNAKDRCFTAPEYSGAPEAPVRYPGKQESGRMGSIGPLMCGGAASTVTKGCASNDLHLCNY